MRPALVSPGTDRRRAVLTLAAVLALNSADSGTVGAIAPLLERDLGLDHTDIGLIAGVTGLVGALATVPAGALTDRVRRTPLLAGSVVLWSLAMVVTALAPDFGWLLLTRLVLGVVTATAWPVVASLIGDLFPPARRGRVWGTVISGQLVGAGVGLVGSGLVGGLLGWRAAFLVLAVPGVLLALAVAVLPEPARPAGASPGAGPPGHADDLAQRVVLAVGVRPREDREPLPGPGERLSLASAVRLVLRVPTNGRLVLAACFGDFFFAGIQVFGLTFLRSRYGLGQAEAAGVVLALGVGALAGTAVGGRAGDALLRRGRPDGRILAPTTAYLLAVVTLVPGFLMPSLATAMPLLVLGAAAVAAANPPLDAARLDIVPGHLRGRAEGVRTVLRSGADAAAPFLVGWLSVELTGPAGAGLQRTYLIMLVPLLVGTAFLRSARRTYPPDVAAVAVAETGHQRDGHQRDDAAGGRATRSGSGRASLPPAASRLRR